MSMLFTPDTTPDANILLSIAGLSKIGGAVAAWQATETSMLQLAPVSFCTYASDVIGCAAAMLACMHEDVHELKGRYMCFGRYGYRQGGLVQRRQVY